MNITVLGSDLRFSYLREMLPTFGHTLLPVEQLEQSDAVVFPLPTTRDGTHVNCEEQYLLVDIIRKIHPKTRVLCGGVPDTVQLMFHLQGVVPEDYSKYEPFAIANAQATAQGAVQLLMEHLDCSLLHMPCLVVGFGRIGKLLSRMLCLLGADVTVSARKQSDLAWIRALGYHAVKTSEIEEFLPQYPVIFNTAPAALIPPDAVTESALLIELAAVPLAHYQPAAQRGATIVDGKALPPRTVPQTAKQILLETVQTVLSEGPI